MGNERLDKLLAQSGACSRREATKLVRSGAVLVNGAVVTVPDQKVSRQDAVTLRGKAVETAQYTYLMLNKPLGVVCATRDNLHKTVLDLVPPALQRPGLFPAGRLDKDSQGFVLITNDGDLAHRILSPKNRVPKTYEVVLDQQPDWAQVKEAFARGVAIGQGEVTSPALVDPLPHPQGKMAQVVIYEGMYHQVRRMFASLGLQVESLYRCKIGGLVLDPNLPPGQCKKILHKDVERIS